MPVNVPAGLLAQVPPEAYVVRLENDIEFHTPGWPQRLAGFLDRSGFGLASARPLDLPPGRSEDETLSALAGFADANQTAAVCFAGGGAYDHYVPAMVGVAFDVPLKFLPPVTRDEPYELG